MSLVHVTLPPLSLWTVVFPCGYVIASSNDNVRYVTGSIHCPKTTRLPTEHAHFVQLPPVHSGRDGEGRVRSVNGEPWALRDSSLTLVVSLLSLTWGAPLAVGLILGEQRPSVDAGESECCVGGDKDGCCYSARQNTTSLHSLFFKGNKEEVERSLDATNWEKRRGGAKWSCAVR